MRIDKSNTFLAVALLVPAGVAGLLADEDRSNSFDFALIGDVPYAPTTTIGGSKVQLYPSPDYDALISDINAHNVAFTVHAGDIKGGDTWCVGGNAAKDPAGAANVYTSNLALFNSFRDAAVYAPGDNEWTDCHRTNNGAYNPTERLAYLRGAGFFPTNRSLGQRPITLTRQSSDAGFELYRENVMWRIGGVYFVVLNQPGSNNNHLRITTASSPLPTDDNQGEYTARNAANIAWLRKNFGIAAADRTSRGIMIIQQANVFERFLESSAGVPQYARSGYESFVNELRALTVAFGKPVVLVGGDTHTVRIDKPMTARSVGSGPGARLVGYPGHAAATGSAVVTPTTLFDTATGATCPTASVTCVASTRVANFTRVEVFGSPDVAWIRGIVDPFDPNVFSFSMQTIAGTGRGN